MFRIEIHYTFYSLTHYLASHWLKEKRLLHVNFGIRCNLQLVLCPQLTVNRLRAQCMISKSTSNCVPCNGVFVVIFFKTMYDKIIVRFGLVISGIIKSRCCHPRPNAILALSLPILFGDKKNY